MVACRLGRTEYVKILVAANADQSTRNAKGENVIHAAVTGNPKADQLRDLFNALDAGLRTSLFLQRKNLHENGNTPLHAWVEQASGVQPDDVSRYRYRYYNRSVASPYGNEKDAVDMLNLLLEYSEGEELEMLNGAGDTCLHTAIMHNKVSLARVLVDFKPRLLYRENAVGRTPAEVAHDRLVGQKLSKPDCLKLDKDNHATAVTTKKVEDIAHKSEFAAKTPEEIKELLSGLGLSDSYDTEVASKIPGSMGSGHSNHKWLSNKEAKQVMWDLCHTMMARHPAHRRLVSLNEANDVAKRLSEKYSASRYFSIQAQGEDDNGDVEEKEDTTIDFATQQLNSRLSSAWKTKGDKELIQESFRDCSECGDYH